MSEPNNIQIHLRGIADPATARVSQGFFKTAAGEYGAGDVFLGIKVPVLRALLKTFRGASSGTVAALLQSQFHEERLFALLLLVDAYQRGGNADKAHIYELYLAHTKCINNWDLVDVSAPYIVGAFLADKPRQALYELAASASLWERRIAIIATLHFIRSNDFDDTLKIAQHLLTDTHDLIHKAVGWMLREVGKRDQAAEEEFLQRHYLAMPRTMLRYAIERFPEARRQQYLQRQNAQTAPV